MCCVIRAELQQREALANACGSELTLLLASALRQEVAARAAGEAAARAQCAQARAEVAAVEAVLAAALEKAGRERDAARGELRAAAAAKHAAQRRHASVSLRAEQLEVHATQLQVQLGALANEHAVCLQQRDDFASRAQALQQSSAEQEARAAASAAAQEDTAARLRELLKASQDRCARYERQIACHWELRSIGAVEAAGRRALAQQLTLTGEQLRSEHYERGRVVTSEAGRRLQIRYSFKYTGAAAKGSDQMPARQALMVHTICHGVAVFVPEDWAPVCSSAARASFAVMQVHSLGWKAGEEMLGPFRSRGLHNAFDNATYGPEPGPLHRARLEVDALRSAVIATHGGWGAWHSRWLAHMDLQINLYDEFRLRHGQLNLACRTLGKKAVGAADRIRQALTMFEERTEAEGEAE
eukprot:TRINITY_DN11177_c1_g3_i2.p1 TRINITY_DN11177_c1_g3~~TRINITY_DN11177_c1_g3_i2.p1  ORF type:complete len:414 (+),score=108.90 TRINITY_DN11177_c1_g3_i2:180-1421(+)